MPLTFGPARLSAQPKDENHVDVYTSDGQEATLTDPVSIDDAGLVSFTVEKSGWYEIISRTGFGVSSTTSVELADDGIGVANPSDIRQRVDAALSRGGGGDGGPVTWASIQNKPSQFPPTAHAHGEYLTDEDLSDYILDNDSRLSDERDPTPHHHTIDDLDVGGVASETVFLRGDGYWASPPGGDGGAVESVNGQTGAVVINPADIGAQPSGNYAQADHDHPEYENPDLSEYVQSDDARLSDAREPTEHSHQIAEVSGLQNELDSKQVAGSYIEEGDTRLSDAREPVAHSHSMGQVTGLSAALDGKQPAGNYAEANHDHAGTYLPASWTPGLADLPPGSIVRVLSPTNTRPTARNDITVWWIGHTTQPGSALLGDVWLEPTA